MGLGITRMNYIALNARDPAAAAQFATKIGFTVAHVGSDGSHYLKAHGPDPYSLVYTPGIGPGMHHASYLVESGAALAAAAAGLVRAGVEVERINAPEWDLPPALRFRTPGGHLIQLTTGIHLTAPLGHAAEPPDAAPAPLGPDHVGMGAINFEIERHFVANTIGLTPSSTIVPVGGPPVMSFMRAPGQWLYHQIVVVRRHENALHHLQFTLKDAAAFRAAHRAMVADGIEIEWGPLRHGPGHNIAMYFRDHEGNWIEYSTEEEIILHDETYVPRTWPADDPKVADEWDSGDPPGELMGPPPEMAAKAVRLHDRMGHMLRKQLYVCLSTVGPEPRPSPQLDVILEHLAWTLDLEAKGKLWAAGPFKTPLGGMQGDGMLIFRAENEAEARALAAQDPIHRGGYRGFEIFAWELHEGRINVSIDLSTQNYRFD